MPVLAGRGATGVAPPTTVPVAGAIAPPAGVATTNAQIENPEVLQESPVAPAEQATCTHARVVSLNRKTWTFARFPPARPSVAGGTTIASVTGALKVFVFSPLVVLEASSVNNDWMRLPPPPPTPGGGGTFCEVSDCTAAVLVCCACCGVVVVVVGAGTSGVKSTLVLVLKAP